MASTIPFAVVVLLAAAAQCHGLNPVKAVKDCGSKMGKFTSVEVSADIAAGNPPEVMLVKGTNVTFQVAFTVNEDVSKATAKVHGIIAGIPVPFPLTNDDGCKNNLPCPLKKGNAYTYKSVIEVKNAYPKIRLIVKWELRDQSGNDIWCVELPAEIKDA